MSVDLLSAAQEHRHGRLNTCGRAVMCIKIWRKLLSMAYSTPMDARDALTIAEAAQFLGISRTCVHALLATGRLPARKLGRDLAIARADLGLVTDRRPGRAADSLVRDGRGVEDG